MNSRDYYKRLINFAARIVLIAFETLAFAFIWYRYYSNGVFGEEIFYRRGHWAVIGIYILILFFFTREFGGYKVGYLRISEVYLSQVLSILCANVVVYIEICAIHRDYVNPMPVFALTLAELMIVLPWVFITRVLWARLFPPRRLLVVYDERSPEEIISKINARPDKYHVCEAINVSKGSKAVFDKIHEYEAIVLCDIHSEIRNDILKHCFYYSIRTYVTPKLSDIIITGAEGIYLFDSPLLVSRNQGLSADQLFIKRVMDIVISLTMLIILLPFMVLVAAAIKLYDKGPVFYYQKRLTRDGKEFKMIKFRSMRMDSEKDGAKLASRNDDRITPVGRFLRRIHFDELPQIINVFKGDMSFVGPRPERPEIAELYSEKIPEFPFRLKVKAGLTGYAQVYGKYNTSPYDKLKLDLTYIENYSVFLDVKIILGTFKVLFQKENTEGFDENKIVPDGRVDEVKKVEW